MSTLPSTINSVQLTMEKQEDNKRACSALTEKESSKRHKLTVLEAPPEEELWKILSGTQSGCEIRSICPPQTLKELEDLLADKFFSVIWVSDKAAIVRDNISCDGMENHIVHRESPGATVQSSIYAGGLNGGRGLSFQVYAVSVSDAETCLARILHLRCTRVYKRVCVIAVNKSMQWSGDLACSLAKRSLQISEHLELVHLRVSSEAIQTLLACMGEKNELELTSCEFLDHGAAFVDALEEIAACAGKSFSGITFGGSLPITIEYFWRFVSVRLKSRIAFSHIRFSDEQCSGFSTCLLRNIHFLHCRFFEDNLRCLEHSMTNKEGPVELAFGSNRARMLRETLYETRGLWEPLLDSLGNALCPLQRLVFNSIGGLQPSTTSTWTSFLTFIHALPCALSKNIGLKELRIHYDHHADRASMMHSDGKDILHAVLLSITTHPSLCLVDFECVDEDDLPLSSRISQAKAVTNMLCANTNIEVVKFYDHMYDGNEWKGKVAPLLEYNTYRKRVELLAGRSGSNPNGTLARAMGRVSSRLTPLWLLISQNQNSIASSIAQDNNV